MLLNALKINSCYNPLKWRTLIDLVRQVKGRELENVLEVTILVFQLAFYVTRMRYLYEAQRRGNNGLMEQCDCVEGVEGSISGGRNSFFCISC